MKLKCYKADKEQRQFGFSIEDATNAFNATAANTPSSTTTESAQAEIVAIPVSPTIGK